jgi:hypothetical protein
LQLLVRLLLLLAQLLLDLAARKPAAKLPMQSLMQSQQWLTTQQQLQLFQQSLLLRQLLLLQPTVDLAMMRLGTVHLHLQEQQWRPLKQTYRHQLNPKLVTRQCQQQQQTR